MRDLQPDDLFILFICILGTLALAILYVGHYFGAW